MFGPVLLPCHNMPESGLGAWNRTRHETRLWLMQDDTTVGMSDTIAAQYTRAGIRCQTAGNLAVWLATRCELRRIPRIMGMEEAMAKRPPWATPLRLLQ